MSSATCAVPHHGFFLRTLPHDVRRPYFTISNMVVRNAIYRILGVSHDVQTLDQLNCVKRQLSLLAELEEVMYRLSSSMLNMLNMLHSLRHLST
jgi:hypothetical protein